MIERLQEAADIAEQLPHLQEAVGRFQHALDALTATGKKDATQRARIAANRLRGLPDRASSGARYDRVRVVQAYHDLTTGEIRRPGFDALNGIDWKEKTWRQCRLDPLQGQSPDHRIVLPLERHQAIEAIAAHFGTTARGVHEQLKRARVKGLPSTWPVA